MRARIRTQGWPMRILMLATLSVLAVQAQDRVFRPDTRSIEQISEHVFRWGSDNQYGAYIATDEGIAVIDGHYCGSGTMQWLKEHLDAGYDVPVRYVVLSHDHQDHNCGTGIFADTAVGIGHVNILPGHGPVTTQDAFIDHYDYLLSLKETVLGHMRAGRPLQEIKTLSDATMREDFGDYNGIDANLEHNIVTMWDYLYRYREPNINIKQYEATPCIEDVRQCRTGMPQ